MPHHQVALCGKDFYLEDQFIIIQPKTKQLVPLVHLIVPNEKQGVWPTLCGLYDILSPYLEVHTGIFDTHDDTHCGSCCRLMEFTYPSPPKKGTVQDGS